MGNKEMDLMKRFGEKALNRRQQMWADIQFMESLKRIKLNLEIRYRRRISMPEVTRKIMENKKFKQIEVDLIQGDVYDRIAREFKKNIF